MADNDDTLRARRFLIWWSATAAVLLALVLLFVMVVDPYGLYRWVTQPGFNSVKPGLERLQTEIKLSHARAMQPDLVLLGNSRVEIGLDPQAPALQGRQAYNLGIPGTGLETTLREVRALRSFDPRLRQAVLGVDFLDFVELRRIAATRPAGGTTAPPADRFWQLEALFSLASVEDAVKTLRIQRDPFAPVLTAQGFNPLQDYVALARSESYHAIFKQKQVQYAQRLARATGGMNAEDFEALAAVLDELAAAGVEVKLVIYPYHGQILALMSEARLLGLFDQWKRRVLALMAQTERNHPQARLSLTDFSGFADHQCERIPAAGDRAAVTQWFWEGGHFKKALGDQMLARLFGDAGSGATFGTSLTAATADANARRVAAEAAGCRAAYPELFDDAAAAFAGAAARLSR